jgi:hypothetical protein
MLAGVSLAMWVPLYSDPIKNWFHALPCCNVSTGGGSIFAEDEDMLSFQSYLLSLHEPPTIPNVFGGSPFFTPDGNFSIPMTFSEAGWFVDS